MEAEVYRVMYDVEESHWWYRALRDLIFSAIDGELGGKGPLRVLDAGCGTGFFLKSLRGRASLSLGVDIEPVALGYCRRRGLRNISRASVEALPFKGQSFDVVVSSDVLYHRRVEDDRGAVREAFRVLREGGVLIANVAAYEHVRRAHDEATHTRHRYTKDEVGLMLREAGFSVRKMSYHNSFLYPAALVMSILHRGDGQPTSSDLRMTARPLNSILYALSRAENALVRKMDLPLGTSLFCVAVKGSRR